MSGQSASAATGERLVLEGVSRAGFYDQKRCPEDFPLGGTLRSFLEYMGDDLGCDDARSKGQQRQCGCTYAYILGISGLASRFLWNRRQWDFGNGNVLHMAADPEAPIRRAFEAVGYDYSLVLRSGFARRIGFTGEVSDDEGYYRRRILESIGAGRPVLGIGMVEPPEFGIVAGYDEGGDVLVGWDYFQDFPEHAAGLEHEPSGRCRRRQWFEHWQGMAVIGERRPIPPRPETNRAALQWAVEVTRTPEVQGYAAGLAAYDAWAETLLRDEEFAADDVEVSRRFMVHHDAAGHIAEGRHYGNLFLRRVAAEEPAMAADLEAAARCYSDEHDLMYGVWAFTGLFDLSDENKLKLKNQFLRHRMVPLIRMAREKDEQAVEHIERALRR